MFERVLNILLFLSLGVILGAVFFFGLGVAGVLFNPELLSSRTIAGGLNASVLERLMVAVTAASIVALGSAVPLMFSRPRRTNAVAFGSLLLLAPLFVYLALSLFPEIDSLRVAIGSFDPVLTAKEDLHVRFTELHGRFSLLVRIGFGLGLIALVAHVLTLVSRTEPGAPQVQARKNAGAPAKRTEPGTPRQPEPAGEVPDTPAADRTAEAGRTNPEG